MLPDLKKKKHGLGIQRKSHAKHERNPDDQGLTPLQLETRLWGLITWN